MKKNILFSFQISQALLIVNSSANFVYYCLVGRAFRRHLFQMLKKYCGCTCQWMKFCIENNSTPENSRPTVVTNLEDSDHENEKHVQRELIRLQSVEVCIWKSKKIVISHLYVMQIIVLKTGQSSIYRHHNTSLIMSF